jgi:U3 small nucleolar RNA-associated protein 11
MGGDGAFKKVAKSRQRTYKERGQPAARVRAGAGLLEKHKDYVVRARAYHAKEAALRTLAEKARFRNPDEFYFRMERSRTKVGSIHALSAHGRAVAQGRTA